MASPNTEMAGLLSNVQNRIKEVEETDEAIRRLHEKRALQLETILKMVDEYNEHWDALLMRKLALRNMTWCTHCEDIVQIDKTRLLVIEKWRKREEKSDRLLHDPDSDPYRRVGTELHRVCTPCAIGFHKNSAGQSHVACGRRLFKARKGVRLTFKQLFNPVSGETRQPREHLTEMPQAAISRFAALCRLPDRARITRSSENAAPVVEFYSVASMPPEKIPANDVRRPCDRIERR